MALVGEWTMIKIKKYLLYILVLTYCFGFVVNTPIAALSEGDEIYYPYYSSATGCSPSGSVSASGEINNADYAGREILNDAQLEQIDDNRPFYEEAAQEHDVPWALLAVIHLLETGLARRNPGNGQGIYQFYNGDGGPYPEGEVTDEEFRRQTLFMAERVKTDFSQRTPIEENREISTSNSQPDAIKDLFFSYNGRASVYINQAVQLGFDRDTQGFEGSPYVMNIADRERDPAFNPTSWGQIKTDGGSLSYPANSQHGAFVVYSALAGLQGGISCSNGITGALGERIVQIARRELDAGANEADGSYLKYTDNNHLAWCAYFVSWVLREAGRPFEEGPIPAVASMLAYARDNGFFHEPTEQGFEPRPGDIAIYKEGVGPYPSHVNIVVSYDASTETYVSIGGNESNTIKEATQSMNSPALTGFMRIE